MFIMQTIVLQVAVALYSRKLYGEAKKKLRAGEPKHYKKLLLQAALMDVLNVLLAASLFYAILQVSS